MLGGSGNERLGNMLILSGLITGVIGVVVYLAVEEIWALIIVGVGISDLAIGALFRSGVIGRSASTSADSDLRTELPAEPDADPATDDGYGFSSTENPYARED